MAAEAAANPIPSADLRSILFIAFLPRLRNEPPQSGAHTFVVNGGAKPKKGSCYKEGGPADGISAGHSPRTAISAIPLQGQLHSTRPDAPEEQLVSLEDPIGIRPEAATAAPRNVRSCLADGRNGGGTPR